MSVHTVRDFLRTTNDAQLSPPTWCSTTARAAGKTAEHAPGSAARGRLFLPWVITTFGGIGPAPIWHFFDSIYATSSSLANLNLTSAHAPVAIRKALHFLARA